MCCNFFVPAEIIGIPKERVFLVPFFEDGALSSFQWYIYLNKDGRHCIVASQRYFGEVWTGPLPRGTWFCSASFEEFVYRIWIECEIWYASSHERRPLSPVEEAYVMHYRQIGLAQIPLRANEGRAPVRWPA